MNIVGLAETPKEIAGLLDLRRRELNLTCLGLDDAAGVQSGYSSKIFCGMKRLGDMSLPAMLGALGCRLVLVSDDGWVPAVTLRCANIAWRPVSRPPLLLPPPHAVFAALPAPREEPPPVIEAVSWERMDRLTR